MHAIDTIGTLAGTLTTLAFLPQIVRTWKTGSARDISLVTFVLFSVGVLLWLIYGILLHALPVVVANGITLLLSGSILALKLQDLRAARRQRSTEPRPRTP